MKKISFILALAALSACNSEENLPSNESVIRLTSEVTPMSRGTNLNEQSTQIVNGQKVGVTITGAKSVHNNVAWTVGNNGEMTNTGDPIYWGDGNVTITAYHPYNAAWTEFSEAPTFTVSVDQTGQGYLDSDLLWATATASKTTDPVPLTFTHQLAKINVTLTSDKISDLSNATISICDTNIEAVFNPYSGDVSSSANTKIRTIKAGVTTSTASAIIIPQTVTAGTKFIQVELDGRYFYYVLPSDKTFNHGNSYSYTLNLKSTVELECVSNNITDWNNENIQGDGGEAGDADITTVTLTDAGTLARTLGDQMLTFTSLKIVGPLNGDDISSLRQMVGGEEFNDNQRGKLTTLDLTYASIVDGGNYYFGRYDYYYTRNNKIGKYMFYNCEGLKSIQLPNSVTTIGEEAFYSCNSLTSANISEGVTMIEARAFYACESLTSVNIPNSVTTIGNGAFSDCVSLTSVNIPDGVTTIGEEAFSNCYSLTSMNIPEGVTMIGAMAFAYCESLTSVNISNNVTTIVRNAFCGCKSLTSVNIPDGVTTIGDSAFDGCTSLTNLTIPKSIITIEDNAFQNCEQLKTIYCYATTPPSINSSFKGINESATLYVPKGTKTQYETKWGEYFKNIVEMEE